MTSCGRVDSAARTIGQRDRASRKPSTGAGSRRAASISPSSTIRDRRRRRSPAATRSAVPNRLASTGIFAGRAASGLRTCRAGPPATSTRRWTSVISWTRLTGSRDAREIAGAPRGSAMKARRSRKAADRETTFAPPHLLRACRRRIDLDQSARRPASDVMVAHVRRPKHIPSFPRRWRVRAAIRAALAPLRSPAPGLTSALARRHPRAVLAARRTGEEGLSDRSDRPADRVRPHAPTPARPRLDVERAATGPRDGTRASPGRWRR